MHNLLSLTIPVSRIATLPASPRDSSKLMVIKHGIEDATIDIFKNLSQHLPQGALVVFNDTRVVPARVMVEKPTGGKVVLLLLVNEFRPGDASIKVLARERLTLGMKLKFPSWEEFQVVGQDKNIFYLKPLFSVRKLPELLLRYGKTPIPPYLSRTVLSESKLRVKYQSIFASRGNSAAAPTASLHFTKRVLRDLKKKKIDKAFVTLDVGLGTFAPVGEQELALGKLHSEFFEIPHSTILKIRKAKRDGRPIVAVGTTALRSLESAARLILSGSSQTISQSTTLFVRDPYRFRVVDALVTNFHVPGSSLVYLVDAFLRYKRVSRSIEELYGEAVRKHFRFYSFGDAMLIS